MTRRSGGLTAISVSVLAGYALWLLAHPASLPSDDALFFVRSVKRFSVVELSPHFPGYPAFVIAARCIDLVLRDAARSVFMVSALAGLSIPVAVYFWVLGSGVERGFAWAAAACALFQPSLPGVSVSMLSDPLGIALALWCVVAIQAERFLASGVLMGLCIAARPSYAVLAVAAFAALLALRRTAWRRFALGFAAIGVAAAGFVLAADGMAYVEEGRRFVAGHFQIWGRGASPTWQGWIHDLLGLAGGAANACIGAAVLAWSLRSLRTRTLATAVSLCMALAYAAWILCAQNPDSARHAAPIVFLALGIGAIGLGQAPSRSASAALAALLLAATLHGFAGSVERHILASPLERASVELSGRDGAVLITQWGVEWMRERHPELRIFDPYYDASARLATRAEGGQVLRLSTSALGAPWILVTPFPARFPGEKSLILYEMRAGSQRPS